MRFAMAGMALALAGCDAAGGRASDMPAEPAKSVMESEAEKACAEMTSFDPDSQAGKPAETQALLRREYDLCVKSVASGGETTNALAPSLRGRSTTP